MMLRYYEMIHKNLSFICFSMFIVCSNVQGEEKDATHSACLDVVTNGLHNSSMHNYTYLVGRENGIEAGVQLAYKKHNISDPLPSSTWPNTIDEACRIVIVDKSNRRAMHVFNEAVFKIYTQSK